MNIMAESTKYVKNKQNKIIIIVIKKSDNYNIDSK